MTPKEIIQELYLNDGIRNREFLNEILHENMQIEWHSSEGLLIRDKNSFLDLANELKQNFSIFNSDVLHLVVEDNKVSIAYNHFGASIENQKDLILIGRFMAIWEFNNGKIIKGYQISRPA